jgi:hypothetical protein
MAHVLSIVSHDQLAVLLIGNFDKCFTTGATRRFHNQMDSHQRYIIEEVIHILFCGRKKKASQAMDNRVRIHWSRSGTTARMSFCLLFFTRCSTEHFNVSTLHIFSIMLQGGLHIVRGFKLDKGLTSDAPIRVGGDENGHDIAIRKKSSDILFGSCPG